MRWALRERRSVLEENLLNPRYHDRQAFTSGVVELDEYLHRFAFQQSKKGIAVVWVLVDTDMPKTILGYYRASCKTQKPQQSTSLPRPDFA